MDHRAHFNALLRGQAPFLALAPMQDVTDGAFWHLMHRYGGADVYWTEYFRVHSTSRLDAPIVESIERNATGKPVVAQLIGNDVAALVRAAKELQQLPVAAIDLNLGCPAPVVYRKYAGGGLLRDPERIDAILGALRDAVGIAFTVKTRLGFDDVRELETLLPIFARHGLDALTVHARTVAQGYRLPVHYDLIRRAVEAMPCPVLANGHVCSARQAAELLARTGARGVMIGRGAIRSPWLFEQIRRQLRGDAVRHPTGREVLAYVHGLWESRATVHAVEQRQCRRMKKVLNYLGEGVPGDFLRRVQRCETRTDLFGICAEFLDHDRPMALEPTLAAAA